LGHQSWELGDIFPVRSSPRQAPSSKAGAVRGNPLQNERVMSPRARERIRLIAGLWLAWTTAGLFYITQDSVPRLYRGEAVPWRYVFVGWMTGMYICAALTPALLWLGNRWPIERRVAYAGFHLCVSVVFSIVATVIEVPLLMALGVFPAAAPPPSVAAGVKVMLSFGIQGGVIRYWAVIVLHAVYRSQENAKTREREAFELQVQASELAQQLAARDEGLHHDVGERRAVVEHLAQRDHLRPPPDEGEHVHAERRLHRGVLVELVEDDLGDLPLAQLQHHPDAVPVRLVADLGQPVELVLARELGDLGDERRLVDLVGQLRHHDGFAPAAELLGVRPRPMSAVLGTA